MLVRLISTVLLLGIVFTTIHAQSGLIPYRKGDKWGYADSAKNIVIPCQYQDAKQFTSFNLAPVQVKGKYGYINTKGKIVIPCKYDEAGEFIDAEHRAYVSINHQYRTLDTAGKEYEAMPQISSMSMMNEDDIIEIGERTKATQGKKIGFRFFDKTPEIPALYDKIILFRSRDLKLLEVWLNYRRGILRFDNTVVIPPEYDEIKMNVQSSISERQIFAVRLESVWGFYNGMGKQLCKPKYTRVANFHWNLCRVTTTGNKEGYINLNGTEYWEE